MMDGWMVGPSPTRCWLRPDADDDDDADANERNMRRHPPLPPPLLAPRPPSPPPLARYRLSSRPSRSPERIRRLRGEQGARKGTNENRTIYPADYSPPLPPAEIPCRILVPRRKRVRRHVSAAKTLRKFAAARFPFDFSSRYLALREATRKFIDRDSTLPPGKPCMEYIYIYV